MGFLSDIFDSVKRKNEELKDRKAFVSEVEKKAKPIRRLAYMEQMLKEVKEEGVIKAKTDSGVRKEKYKPKPKKVNPEGKPMSLGEELQNSIDNPFKFLGETKSDGGKK